MKRQPERYCIVLLLLAVLFIVCGCLGTGLNTLPSTKYSAVEADLVEEGTIIAGNTPIGDAMPPQIFYYNKDMVHGWFGNSTDYAPGYPEMNKSLKLLLGTYHVESMPWRLRSTLDVTGIYGYPYTFDNGPTILDVDRNGTIRMKYDNATIDLKIGDEWKSPAIATRTENNIGSYVRGEINGTYSVVNESYTIRWDTTWTIKNLGAYDK